MCTWISIGFRTISESPRILMANLDMSVHDEVGEPTFPILTFSCSQDMPL